MVRAAYTSLKQAALLSWSMPTPTHPSDDDPAAAELQADGLRLRPLRPEHAEAMYPVLADPAIYTHLDYGPPPSLGYLREVFTQLAQGGSADGTEVWLNWVVWVTGPQGGEEAAGYVQATVIAPGTCWVAYVFGSRFHGRGIARRATAAMVEHLHAHCGITLLLASAEAAHGRSIHLMQQLGMRPATPEEAAPLGLRPSEVLYLRVLPPV